MCRVKTYSNVSLTLITNIFPVIRYSFSSYVGNWIFQGNNLAVISGIHFKWRKSFKGNMGPVIIVIPDGCIDQFSQIVDIFIFLPEKIPVL